MAPKANFFIGVNGGLMNLKFTPSNETSSRTISDPYFGGDAGFNIHVSDSVDFELGARVMDVQAKNTNATNNVTYNFNDVITGYGSLIYKFKMN